MIKSKDQLRCMLHALRGKSKTMTGNQFKDAIQRVGLSQQRAGLFFGVSDRTGQNWALSATPIPPWIKWCLDYMVEHGLSAEDWE
jgi:hypothetical protein